MSRKAVYSMVLFFVLMGVLGVSINVHKVEAPHLIIFIGADGSINPSGVNITSSDNVTYTFTDDINASIVVQRSNITIDGTGHTLDGLSGAILEGLNLTGVSNVTIKNVNVVGFGYGIYLQSSILNIISGNNITFNEGNIYLGNSSDNTITGNTITDGAEAIQLYASSNNTISGNSMSDNYNGVWSRLNSAENVISGNNITNNYFGINLDSSSHNIIEENNCSSNTVIGINIFGVNNTVRNNNVSSTVAGTGIIINYGHNNTIVSNNIKMNVEGGITLTTDSCYNIIINNNISLSHPSSGIYLTEYSNNNTIRENNLVDNPYGVYIIHAYNNSLFHNNFINNTKQVYNWENASTNTWDDGFEGNYWSNYTGVDLDRDGIGDSWLEIDENNTDHYPLMGPFHSYNTTMGKHVNVISNSTIESFQHFESNSTIVIHVSNMTADQTHGFCRISIPYEVMSGQFNVTIDGANPTYWNYTIYDDGKNRWIYFEYEHTTRKILIIPEFPSLLILPLLMMATLLAVIIYRRKHSM